MLIERRGRQNAELGIPKNTGRAAHTRSPRSSLDHPPRPAKRCRYPRHRVRDTNTTWRKFLRAPAWTMLACDVFGGDCAVTLKRISVLVVLQLARRSVHLLSTTPNPDRRETTQQIRTLMMDPGDRCGCRIGHPCHATWVYEWISPPSRSRRRRRKMSPQDRE